MLFLDSTAITSAGVNKLAELRHLRVLYLDKTKIDNAALIPLAKVASLRQLSLKETEVTVDGIAAFRKRRPDVKLVLTTSDGG